MRQIRFFAAVIFLCLFAALADAQATRTWVSGVGDDVNPCSRTAPCKTFAGAISKTATNGEINCLDSGGFGTVTITKSITIDCKGTIGGILASLTNGILINNAIATVRLRGLNINGAGNGLNGVKIVAATAVNVEDSVIDGFTQHGVLVENSGNVKVVLNNSAIRNNAVAVMGASTGSANIMVANSILSGSNTAIFAGLNSTIRISGNLIVANMAGLTGQGKIISFKNNTIDGNASNGSPTSTVVLQ
ncbi:MAG: hypothetical protein ACKVRN_06740 [Pyrinomonadaceae bacterium]